MTYDLSEWACCDEHETTYLIGMKCSQCMKVDLFESMGISREKIDSSGSLDSSVAMQELRDSKKTK